MNSRVDTSDVRRGPYPFTIDGEELSSPQPRMEAQQLIVIGVRHKVIALADGESPAQYELEAGDAKFSGEDIVDLTRTQDFIAVHVGGAPVAGLH